jgi:hypothetical protein
MLQEAQVHEDAIQDMQVRCCRSAAAAVCCGSPFFWYMVGA